jgi:cobalt-zinc-cadmium efflux system membrane fusion protein
MKARLFIFAALPLILAGCGQTTKTGNASEDHHEEDAHTEGEVVLTAEQEALAGIKVETVRPRQIQEVLTVPGVVTSMTKGRSLVTPPVAGRIVAINVELGSSVRQGQTLAILESSELAETWAAIAEAERSRDAAGAALKESNTEVRLAEVRLSSARSNLARQTELATAGAFSQAPLQQAQSELSDAQSELLSLQKEEASHAELVRRLENLYRDGIVSKSELEAARLELQQDQIRLERSLARVSSAKSTVERERTIASRGLLNAKELQSAEAEVKASQLELERAKGRTRSAEAALANATRAVTNARALYRSHTAGGAASVGRVSLVAPISGTVTHLDVTKGQAVDRTQALMEVENLSSVWVTANVPEQSYPQVRVGADVMLQVTGLGDEQFEGVVQIVGSRVDPKTRAIPVQCLVRGVSGRLKPNMFASVSIAHGTGKQLLAVPASAVVSDGKTSFVFVKSGDGYLRTEVEVGERSGGYVAINSGLAGGESVVSQGSFILLSELKKAELKGHDH